MIINCNKMISIYLTYLILVYTFRYVNLILKYYN